MKSGAVGVSLLGIPASAAADGDSQISLEEAGITKPVKEALVDGNLEKARKLMDKYDINHSMSTTPLAPSSSSESTTPSSELKVGTEAYLSNPDWSGSGSTLTTVAAALTNHIHLFSIAADLTSHRLVLDDPGPPDGISVSYSDIPYVTQPGTVDSSASVSSAKPNQYGVYAEANDGLASRYFSLLVEAEERLINGEYYSGNSTIYGDYVHTWHFDGAPIITGLSFALPRSGVTVTADGTMDKWRAEDNVSHSV